MLCVIGRSVFLKRQHAIILNVGFKKLQFFLKKKKQNIHIFCKFSLVNLHAEIEYSMGTVEHRADIYLLKEKQ